MLDFLNVFIIMKQFWKCQIVCGRNLCGIYFCAFRI